MAKWYMKLVAGFSAILLRLVNRGLRALANGQPRYSDPHGDSISGRRQSLTDSLGPPSSANYPFPLRSKPLLINRGLINTIKYTSNVSRFSDPSNKASTIIPYVLRNCFILSRADRNYFLT